MLLVALTFATKSHAQLRWDIGARVGGGKRYLGSQPRGVGNAEGGPAAELTVHTALLPLLKVGPTVSGEVSPVNGRPTRRHVGVGLEARLFAPLPWPQLRPFAFVGIRGVLARQSENERHAAGGGTYLSVPFGIGTTMALRKGLKFVATFGGEGAFAHGGILYNVRGPLYVGNDVAAVRGMLGVDVEF